MMASIKKLKNPTLKKIYILFSAKKTFFHFSTSIGLTWSSTSTDTNFIHFLLNLRAHNSKKWAKLVKFLPANHFRTKNPTLASLLTFLHDGKKKRKKTPNSKDSSGQKCLKCFFFFQHDVSLSINHESKYSF